MLGKALTTAAAGNAGAALGIEDVFSTWLYTGTGIGSTQTITNGIDLAGEGGMVWLKSRTNGSTHYLFDTERGVTRKLYTNDTDAEVADADSLTAFNSDGFLIGDDTSINYLNAAHASWTFRKAPGFFDVVTWTGNGSASQTINHNLGSAPGCIIIKATSTTSEWFVWHRNTSAAGVQQYESGLLLNSTSAQQGLYLFSSTPTSTSFTVSVNSSYTALTANGVTFVAYLFAHDEQIFGDAGDQSVIKCGSYSATGSTSGPVVDLGWEPQWLMIKRTDSTGDWNLIDNMRGFCVGGGGDDAELNPNLTAAESSGIFVTPLSTGFQLNTTDTGYNASSGTYIYIAIRRGLMKKPTNSAEVFSVYSGTPTDGTLVTTGFPVDFLYQKSTGVTNWRVVDRLRGYAATSANNQPRLQFNNTDAESLGSDIAFAFDNVSYKIGNGAIGGTSGISHAFRRAPGFFDVVAYTGTGVATQTIPHNLGVTPQLIIVKCRSNSSTDWLVKPNQSTADYLHLNFSNAQAGPSTTFWSSTNQDATNFYVGPSAATGAVSRTFVAYLFASCPGVSKVGSYTGTGTTLDIGCGFTSGARFVMIKRTDSTGDWYVWDTARGIVAGNDPYLLLNSDSGGSSADYIDPLSSGFQISSTAPAAINANGGTYIYLAIA